MPTVNRIVSESEHIHFFRVTHKNYIWGINKHTQTQTYLIGKHRITKLIFFILAEKVTKYYQSETSLIFTVFTLNESD